MESFIFTVQEINTLLKKSIENEEYFKNIYVIGELSNLTLNKSGHIYFSIKDEKAAISCMIWKDNGNKLINLNPKEGMKITCSGRITYYVPTGKINFEVRDVKLEGKGELQEIFDQRKNELEKAGWFDRSLKKPIPRFPKNIGIVTAPTGAAIRDIVTTIKRRYPLVNIFLFPSQVQGEQAQFDISKKIKQADSFVTKLDLLIVGRGGGSYEDLWSFNEMPVLQAIKDANIPIISAVGHEPDTTLADYVADFRAATPTAAGEISTPDILELKRELSYYYSQYKKELQKIYEYNQKQINTNQEKILNTTFNHIKLETTKLESLKEHFIKQIKNFYLFEQNNLKTYFEKFELLNPKKPLEKGYALLKNKNGQIINSNNDFKLNDEIEIVLKKLLITSEIKDIKENK
ncbi:exodeoxyribonuclease VII large subunit [Williamsoniiplasma somnilux]|uniref:Exodeoxyribonuclease 7 large subunit n=1 Tax=Williamsoniiplasma somnilux TaxID=215578 RepID=A0A2K8NY59_9MOLU|nr:exodeoxyribonuclease VII large subunit [Williamsoniiplasma somnilux]ATZ18759.1 exodeoxyribonuclease VII large subunit [Williamsoniiplasma somnilux]